MKLYVLIGGMGSGKTTVQRMFQDRGAVCLDLDEVGHEVLGHADVRQALAAAFGPEVLDAQGTVDRRRLASVAFASEEGTRRLEAIVQPAILDRAERKLAYLEGAGLPVAVVEISAWQGPGGAFDGLVGRSDGVVAVAAPAGLRLRRAVAQGFDEQDVLNRMARQATDEQRGTWAHLIIDNGGSLDDLRTQVDAAWQAMEGGLLAVGDQGRDD